MRISSKASSSLLLVLAGGLLFACNVFNKYSQLSGITYVASLGNPEPSTLVWSPKDATKILVSANSLFGHYAQVYILDTTTAKKTMLVNAAYGQAQGSGWSPNGRQIALSVDSGTQGFSDGGLWVVNVENNSMEHVIDRAGTALWLSDGRTLAFETADFASDQNPRPIAIALMDFQTRNSELIYSTQKAVAFSTGFSSSPDGQYLVFSLLYDLYSLPSDVYTLDMQTGIVNQLTHDGTSSSPQWSPQGPLIVYEKTHKVGNNTISSLHITAPDGSCDIEIPNLNYALSPTWSPDGRKIAFIGEDGIYVLDVDEVFGRDIYENLCP